MRTLSRETEQEVNTIQENGTGTERMRRRVPTNSRLNFEERGKGEEQSKITGSAATCVGAAWRYLQLVQVGSGVGKKKFFGGP